MIRRTAPAPATPSGPAAPWRDLLRAFLHFALLSGVGWLLDFGTFALLVRVAGVSPFLANFVSSYVGATFVWFASLKMVFRRARRTSFLAIYWGYQFVSTLAYSRLLQEVVVVLGTHAAWATVVAGPGIAAKIVITPFNLMTNFLFMKLLTRAMHPEQRRAA